MKMQELIERAYNLFRKYRADRPLDICTDCCMKEADAGLLASLPVNEIPKELLMEYNDGASAAKTPIDELKHFLPRYFELTSQFEFPTHSTEITFRRLDPFLKEEWTDNELEMLEEFSTRFFNYCLSKYPLPIGEVIDSILIMFWRGQFRIDTLLNIWTTDKSLNSTLHFKDLCMKGFKLKNPSKMSNAFGEEDISKIIRTWIDSEQTKTFFRENIENLIMDEVEIDEIQLYQLNVLYEMIK